MVDRLSNRADIIFGLSAEIGGPGLKAPETAAVKGSFANTPFEADIRRVNTSPDVSLVPLTLKATANADHMLRLPKGTLGAFSDVGYQPGTKASAFSFDAGASYLHPFGNGKVSLIARVNAGAARVAGDTAGWMAEVAAAAGVRVYLSNTPIEVQLGYKAATGRLSNHYAMEGGAATFTVGIGLPVIKSGRDPKEVSELEGQGTAFPRPLSKCEVAQRDFETISITDIVTACQDAHQIDYNEMLQRLSSLPVDVKQYQKATEVLVGRFASYQKPEDMERIEALWERTLEKDRATDIPHPATFFIQKLAPKMFAAAAINADRFRKLAGLYDKALKAAEGLPAAEKSQLMQDVLTQFYMPIFRKGNDAAIQAEYRSRSDAILKDLLGMTKGDPGMLKSVLKNLTRAAKGTSFLKPHKALLKAAAKNIADVDEQKAIMKEIDTASA